MRGRACYRYGTGDRVGVLLDMEANEIRFTKNGHDQGVAYKGVFSKENIGHGVQAAVCIGGIQRQRAYVVCGTVSNVAA